MKAKSPPPGQSDMFSATVLPFKIPPHRHESDTSRAAAIAVQPTHNQRVLAYHAWLQTRGKHGATDSETADHFSWLRSSICALRNVAMKNNLVVDSGLRRNGKCKCNGKPIKMGVYIATTFIQQQGTP